jgi:hypothetical protein
MRATSPARFSGLRADIEIHIKPKLSTILAYLGEEVFTLALADQKQGEYRELLEKALKFLTREVAFPGTDCYGEVSVWVDVNGQKFAQQRTSIPHLWNGATLGAAPLLHFAFLQRQGARHSMHRTALALI